MQNKIEASDNFSPILKIEGKSSAPLSKNQVQFNKLTLKIEQLENTIESKRVLLAKLNEVYNKKIPPLSPILAQSYIELAEKLTDVSKLYKFSKSQVNSLGATILDLLDEAFCHCEPTPEQEALYNEWSGSSYQEEIETQKKTATDQFAFFAEMLFGLKVDPENFTGSPEDLADLKQQLEEQERQRSAGKKEKKKTAKQLEKERLEKEKENIKAKNIRSIYIALAKVLHPDTETDPELKVQKEEIMKKVTVAYDDKDLVSLLKIEAEWLKKTTEHLNDISDDVLSLYIATLKEQVYDLEQELNSLSYDPMYQNVSEYVNHQEKTAVNKINAEARELKGNIEFLKEMKMQVEHSKNKTQIINLLKRIGMVCVPKDDFDGFFPF